LPVTVRISAVKALFKAVQDLTSGSEQLNKEL